MTGENAGCVSGGFGGGGDVGGRYETSKGGFGTRFSITVFRYGGFGDGGAAGVKKKKTVASVDLVASAMVIVMTV
ncbi:hypothetical protein A2U01_0081697, partial [Trifolium medium]|nr:hypothetical protein [Trifolium medium]